MEKFIHENILFAIIVRNDFHRDGINFMTDGKQSLEMAYMSHPAGHTIKPHRHVPLERTTLNTQEVLFLKSGKLRIDIYSNDNVCVGSRELNGGDWIILLSGGHGFEILEPSVLFEVKQGPYAGDKDKVRFEPVQSKDIAK
ncbi:MAG: hypothetical protein ACJZ18_04020 [Methylophilaceae bacterium]